MGKIGKIEDNVPMPSRRAIYGHSKYPLDKLEVGQSFPVDLDYDEDVHKLRDRVRGSVLNFCRRRSKEDPSFTKKFRVAIVFYEPKKSANSVETEQVPRGVRVWRLE